MSLFQIRLIFVIAAVFDFLFVLGILVAGATILQWAGISVPDHWGPIQFGSLLLMIFGLMFAAVAFDPVSQRNLIRYGLLMKLNFCGLVAYYWMTSEVPILFRICAIADAILYVLFLVSYLKLGKRNPA
jgi:hypothetical protein